MTKTPIVINGHGTWKVTMKAVKKPIVPSPSTPEYPRIFALALAAASVMLLAFAGTTVFAEENIEDAKLAALDADPGDNFGYSVALSGQTMVVAAPGDDCAAGLDCGGAYVFESVSGLWIQRGKLVASDAGATDTHLAVSNLFSDKSVAISGDTIVVTAPGDDCPAGIRCGSAYVYVKPKSGWTDMPESAKLSASDASADASFGSSVAINDDVLVIGASSTGPSVRGAAYVFEKPVGGWADTTETAKLTASDTTNFDQLGYSVSLTMDTIVVSAFNYACSGGALCRPAVYVFAKPLTGWTDMTQTAKLTAGVSFQGPGSSVSISSTGDTIVAGAKYDNCTLGFQCGSAYVFVKPEGGWVDMTQTAKLTASDIMTGDWFGGSVAVSGNKIVVGTGRHECSAGVNCGSAYFFVMPVTGWADMTQTAELVASDAADSDFFGTSVSIDGPTIVVGSPLDECEAGDNCGSAYEFSVRSASIPAVSSWGVLVLGLSILTVGTRVLGHRRPTQGFTCTGADPSQRVNK